MSIEVRAVTGAKQLKAFIDFPHTLYKGVENYVPQLFRQQKELLDPWKSPFAEHSSMKLFLALKDGRVAGRIAAIENTVYNKFHHDRMGFFGFFDCGDDKDVAAKLFKACSSWLENRGLDKMRGPVNPDMNNSCGILVEGFDELPTIFMPFNAPYYRELLEGQGLKVCKGLNAWDIQSALIPEAVFNYGRRIQARLEKAGYRMRPVHKRGFDEDMLKMREIYNNSMEKSWGATPITAEEFHEQSTGLKLICKNEYIQIAEFEGKVVGFIGAAPNVSEILKDIPRGRLFPTGWAKLLLGWRSIKGSRIVMYGVDPEHRNSGLGIWLYIAIIETLRRNGFASAEASYVLEDNVAVNGLSKRLGGQCRKRYAIFEKPLRRNHESAGEK